MDVVLKSIHDPSCVYLCQHLTTEGVDMAEPATNIPEGWTFLRQLPKKVQKTEVWELIMMCFNHLSEVHTHMSLFMANISSLAKIADPETFNMVMKAAARPMIQINVLGHYLSLVQDPPPKTTAEECLSWLEKVLLPQPSSLTPEPQYGPTRLLAAVVWLHLKHKFSMAAPPRRLALCLRCEPNNCQSCCWVRFTLVDPLELPRANVSGLTLLPMREMWLVMSLPLCPPLQEVNIIITGSSSTGGTKMGFIYDYTQVTTCNCLPPPQPSV